MGYVNVVCRSEILQSQTSPHWWQNMSIFHEYLREHNYEKYWISNADKNWTMIWMPRFSISSSWPDSMKIAVLHSIAIRAMRIVISYQRFINSILNSSMFFNYGNPSGWLSTFNGRGSLIEGNLEIKFPTIWIDEKQSREEAERREKLEEIKVEEKE